MPCLIAQLPFLLNQSSFASAFTDIREAAGQPPVCPSVTDPLSMCLSLRVSVCVKVADNHVWCDSA